jgi:hypothetical protein
MSQNGCKKYYFWPILRHVYVINTALQNLIYWVRVLHAPIFHIFCTSENLIEIIHFAHCKTHCMHNHTLNHTLRCVTLNTYSGVLEPQKNYVQKIVHNVYIMSKKDYCALPCKWSSRNLSENDDKLALSLCTTVPPLTAFHHWPLEIVKGTTKNLSPTWWQLSQKCHNQKIVSAVVPGIYIRYSLSLCRCCHTLDKCVSRYAGLLVLNQAVSGCSTRFNYNSTTSKIQSMLAYR